MIQFVWTMITAVWSKRLSANQPLLFIDGINEVPDRKRQRLALRRRGGDSFSNRLHPVFELLIMCLQFSTNRLIQSQRTDTDVRSLPGRDILRSISDISTRRPAVSSPVGQFDSSRTKTVVSVRNQSGTGTVSVKIFDYFSIFEDMLPNLRIHNSFHRFLDPAVNWHVVKHLFHHIW